MAGVNKVILIGNMGKDPEVRHLEGGATVASFSLATSDSYTDKRTNERITQTEWHNIVAWRKTAEYVEKYLSKGRQVYVEGKLRTRSWTDKEGVTRYTTEVVADTIQPLGARPNTDGGMQMNTQTAQVDTKTSTSTGAAPTEETKVKDDLPF